ncbi:SDR family oxidoreductase [Senegalia massiliensis]|uniref:SDR family oxidoreductase n=1 Tax=Senegalia massiliensis TaxID=1720316 RepID=A0A845QUN9_9CLOT|nr:SDR family oxidoreductase [Senegalia massiliensis]NBI05961.1 SDR family oxidoreductase [Senegalia massiliensis]
MANILLTGISGNVGSAVMDYFIKNNIDFTAGVRNVEKYKEKFPGINLVHLDFEKKDTFNRALEGMDKVFLVRPPQLTDVNRIFKPFINRCKQKFVRRIVFLSLLGIEKNPFPPHHKIEKIILESNIPYTFIRPSFFMQNLSTTHKEDIKERNDIFIPGGNARVSFIDTRDIGEVIGITLTEKGHRKRAYTITGCEAISYYEVANKMSNVLGKDIKYSNPSLLQFRKEMINRGVKKEFANVMTVLYLTTKLGMARKVTDTAENILKRKPRTIDDFIKDYSDEWI